ncbi:class I SAM-dependent methyltransferase [Streptomyces iconiensis]|uniref:Class I SAM-dependent methyltransferase n=1 Tax=Streptomyces iconiensis TaxID=1384038 RepID=A0ABT6ZZJ7_9ACTN|nr:class I SAM-dependent methyltransferase [Streptomyces iconiensis]MDJ1134476.1 class I SAM-dependent methyltransferase [Streptomyces iconiensis]
MTQRLGELFDGSFSLLDCGVMSGVTYDDLRRAGLAVDYTGVDMSDSVLADCRERRPEATWRRMNVMDLAFPDASFDVAHCRHVLEHLPYYETAVRELFRVARRYVVLCFFIVPSEPERLSRRPALDGSGYVWLNQYAPGPLDHLLRSLATSVEVIDVPEARRPNRVYVCATS